MSKRHKPSMPRFLSLILIVLLMLSAATPAAAATVTGSSPIEIQINQNTALDVFIQDTFRYPDVFTYRIASDAEAIMNSLHEGAGFNLMLLLSASLLDFSLSLDTTGGGQLRITPTYLDTAAERAEVRNYVNQSADALFHSNMTDLERLAAVNLHLVENFSYDETYSIYSAHPFITSKTGVCQSYAQLGVMLLLAGGLGAYPLSGTADGVSHAWISVKVNGTWYEFDPTYNDSIGYQDASTRTLYLTRTHDEMLREGRTYDEVSPYTYQWEDGLRQTMLPPALPPEEPVTPDAPVVENGTPSPYADIQPGQWYYEAAMQMSRDGLMIGTGGDFLPEGTVTLAQIITVAARLHARDNSATDFLTALTDDAAMKKKPWYQGYVDYALSTGILMGNEFRGMWADRNATREEMAYILQRTAGRLRPVSSVTIPDIGAVSAPYVLAVRTMANAGIINGVDNANTFLPAGIATRAQLAVILTRLQNATPF